MVTVDSDQMEKKKERAFLYLHNWNETGVRSNSSDHHLPFSNLSPYLSFYQFLTTSDYFKYRLTHTQTLSLSLLYSVTECHNQK